VVEVKATFHSPQEVYMYSENALEAATATGSLIESN
jgi:hypothetical protein